MEEARERAEEERGEKLRRRKRKEEGPNHPESRRKWTVSKRWRDREQPGENSKVPNPCGDKAAICK